MEDSPFIKQYAEFVAYRPDRYGKATLFENEQILVGLNCLHPGQSMQKHAHDEQNRFYYVIEGKGDFWNGEAEEQAGSGAVVWIPCGSPHRITNPGPDDLVMLVGISPAHAD